MPDIYDSSSLDLGVNLASDPLKENALTDSLSSVPGGSIEVKPSPTGGGLQDSSQTVTEDASLIADNPIDLLGSSRPSDSTFSSQYGETADRDLLSGEPTGSSGSSLDRETAADILISGGTDAEKDVNSEEVKSDGAVVAIAPEALDSPIPSDSQTLTAPEPSEPPQPDGSGSLSEKEKSPSNFGNVTFTSGVFTVGETGSVSFDYLFDGGGYQGQVAAFSLTGMQEFQQQGLEAFVREALSRSLSNSPQGYVVISDLAEGARFSGSLGEPDANKGDYQGIKTFEMTAGDTFGVLLVPDSTVSEVFKQINEQGIDSLADSKRPLFSMAASNPAKSFNFGQIADVIGDGSTFVFEDLRVDKWTDKDYNDFIFQVKGAVGEAALMKEVINQKKNWYDSELGQALVKYATREVDDGTEEETGSEEKITDGLSDPVKYAIERSQNLETYDPQALEETSQWVVGVTPGYSAEEFATLYEAENVGATGHVPNSYIWNFPATPTPEQVQARLDALNGIEFAYPLVSVSLKSLFAPNDQFFNKQWHLENTGQTGGTVGVDANITPAWEKARGEGVTIGIVDDGLQYTHPDLAANYRPELSADFNEGDILKRQYDIDPAPFSQNVTVPAKLAAPQAILDEDLSFEIPDLNVGLKGFVEKLQLTVDVEHPAPSELKLYLSSPKGTLLEVPSVSSSGVFAIDTERFNGEQAGGKWSLVIEDTAAGNEGELKNWSLTFDTANPHGTAVAGVAVATGNNSIGVSGAAPGADWAGLRLTGDTVQDIQIADALYSETRNQAIDIYNNSWKTPPLWAQPQGLMALEQAAAQGRGGLGNVYVFGAGNDWYPWMGYAENVNYNAYASSRYTMAVGAIDHKGTKAPYSQEGASLFVSAPSGWNGAGISTTDLSGSDGRNANGTGKFGANYSDLDYTNDFDGTSAAAPLVSGVVGLMLEENPLLSWRDVQHIIAETSNRDKINDADAGWSGAVGDGIRHSQKYGFGIIDAAAAVDAAANWTPVAPEVRLTSGELLVNKKIPDNHPVGVTQKFSFAEDITVESAEVVFDATHPYRGDLEIELTAPDGTKSLLANSIDDSGDNYYKWVFNSVRHWGDSSQGEWTLQVRDRYPNNEGTWKSWKLNLYGTKPTVAISATDANASESGDAGEFTITRTGNTTNPLTVNYTLAGSANNGTDYGAGGSPLQGFVTIPAGAASAKLPIIPVEDLAVEGNETVVVNLAAGTAYNLGTTQSATVNIADNDVANAPPTLTAVSTLSGATQNQPFTITYANLANAANEADADGDALSFQIESVTSGTLSKNGVAVVPGVTALAAGEQLVWMPAGTGAAVGAFTVRANDGEAVSATAVPVSVSVADLPTVTVTATDASASESGDPGQIAIARTGSTDKALTVTYAVAGTATNGSDYGALNGSITIPVGASSVTVNITPVEDSAVEGNETVVLNLTPTAGYQVGAANSATVNIADNELLPTVILIPGNSNASESGMSGGVNVFRTDVAQPLTVNYTLGGTATNGSDYEALTGSVTIPAGSYFAAIPIIPKDDAEFEGEETVIVSLAAGSYNAFPGSHTVTIADNDKPTVTLSATDASATEGGEPGQFTITRTGTTQNPLTVNYSVAGTASNGSDYSALSGSITIPAGANTAAIAITPQEDEAVEGNETVVLNLTADSAYNLGADKSGMVNIADNDNAAEPFTNIATSLSSVWYGALDWGDYDNDGDLDILLTGSENSISPLSRVSQVYRNDNSGEFTDIQASLTGIYLGAVEWGDYDNDNDLDILLTGAGYSKIYRNDEGIFIDIGASLTGIYAGSVAWGDYDNDGDLDIILTGNGKPNTLISKIYRNDSGNFTDIGASLIGVKESSVAWGDYDSDGDLDLLLTGSNASIIGNATTKIYRNDGSSGFTDIGVPLAQVWRSSAAWGDYDNDGDLDILLTGVFTAKVYQNNGGTFTDIRASLPQVSPSSAAWGDYDNDGDLDILLTGNSSNVENSSGAISKVYRNDSGNFTDTNAPLDGIFWGDAAWGDYNNDGDLDILLTGQDTSRQHITKIYQNNTAGDNTTPTAPTGLNASINGTSATLSWNPATDAQTPQKGLTYNLRVGTTPGGSEIMSPMSNADGTRLVAQMGNVNHNTDWTLNNLKPGTYYWSVQAIDTAFEGSPFASQGSFTVGSPTNWNATFINRTFETVADRTSYDFTNPAAVLDLGDQHQGRSDGGLRLYTNWPGSPTSGVQNDNFAMQAWTRANFEAGKLYKITTRSDDGTWFRLKNAQTGEWLGDSVVVSGDGADWRDRSATDAPRTIFFKVPESGDYDFYIDYYEKGLASVVDVNIEEAKFFQDPVNGGQWASTFFWWDRKNGNVPPGDFYAEASNRIGTVNLGSNIRNDGKPGISFDWGEVAPLGDVRLPDNNFAVRSFTQTFLESGVKYRARVRGDDGFQLLARRANTSEWVYITPKDQWQQAYGAYQTVDFTVPTTDWYDMHFHHYEERGATNFDLSWEVVPFTGTVISTIGANVRSGPGRSNEIVDLKTFGELLIFDRWTTGDFVDYTAELGTSSDRWYRIAGTDRWISAAVIEGEPS